VLGADAPAYRETLLYFAARALGDVNAHAPGAVGPAALLRARLRLLEHTAPARRGLRRAVSIAAMAVVLLIAVPVTEEARRAAASVEEWVERPPGCLQLRFMVLQRLSESRNQSSEEKK
jgi:hypothetical protein